MRAASRSTGEIAAEDHSAWFSARIADASTLIFIVEYRGAPVGQVRIDRLNSERGEIHVAAAAGARNRRLAAPTLRNACRHASRELRLRTIIADVPETSIASLRAFARAGFIERSRADRWVTLGWASPQQAE